MQVFKQYYNIKERRSTFFQKNMKTKIAFFNSTNLNFLTIFILFLGCLFLSDEGRKPLIYEGNELQYSSTENISTFCTPKFLFNKGTYNINISFDDIPANTPKIELWRQSEKLDKWQIAQNTDNFSTDFSLPYDSQDVQFRIVFNSKQQPTIEKLTIAPKTFFYSDTYFMIVLFLLTAIFAQLYFAKNKLTQQQIVDIFLIFGIATLCTFPFFSTVTNYGIDKPYHLARIEGIKDGILDGQIGVNILPNGTENYGYLNSLYPYLFLYIPALFRLCNVSLILSYKLFIFLINLATVASVYISAKSITKSRLNIFLTVILYVFVPWRLVNIFYRAAIGEFIAEIFWPLIIAGLYSIIVDNQKKWYFLAIGCSGMIQAHINSALMTVIFCGFAFFAFIYIIFSEKRFLSFVKAAVCTLFFNIWYIIPFLFYYFNSKNNCTLDQLKTTYYFEGSINLANLIRLNLAEADATMGLHIVTCIAIGLLVLCFENKTNKTRKNSFCTFLLFAGILCAFATVSYFPNRFFMQKYRIFAKIAINFQYPIRLLAPASFFIIFATLECLEKSQLLKNYRKIISAILIMCSFVPFLSITKGTEQFCYESPFVITTRAHKEKLTPKFFYAREYNNESVMQTYAKNYSMQNKTYNYNAEDFFPYPMPSVKDNVAISNFSENGTKLDFTYTATGDNLTVEVPLQWYSGYKAFNENKQPLPITKSSLGKIQVPLVGDGTEHRIHVQYGPIPLFIAANIISAISICGLLILLLYKKKKVENI